MLTIVESPFKGATPFEAKRNIAYARKALSDSLDRGESPVAFHLIYTQPGILDDEDPMQRDLGISRSFDWAEIVPNLVIAAYCDFGVSRGMEEAFRLAKRMHRCVQKRFIGTEIEPKYFGLYGGM